MKALEVRLVCVVLVILVVRVVLVVCVYSACRRREREKEKKEKRQRKEETERERERARDKNKERKGCFWQRPAFLLLVPGSALEKFAAIVSPENKPIKVNWTLSWPSALQFCGKTVL